MKPMRKVRPPNGGAKKRESKVRDCVVSTDREVLEYAMVLQLCAFGVQAER